MPRVTSGEVDGPCAEKPVSWEVSLVPRRSWRRSWLGWRHPKGFGFPVFHIYGSEMVPGWGTSVKQLPRESAQGCQACAPWKQRASPPGAESGPPRL